MDNLLTRARECANKLRRMKKVAPASRSDVVGRDGGRPAVVQQYAEVPINPDGPEAADLLDALAQPMGEEAVEAVRQALIKADEEFAGIAERGEKHFEAWPAYFTNAAIAALAAQPLPVSSDEEKG